MEEQTKARPSKVLMCGSVQIAIWLHATEKDGEVVDVHSVKISKSYKDTKTGEWKYTDHLFIDDLPKVVAVATELYKDLRVKRFGPNGVSHAPDAC